MSLEAAVERAADVLFRARSDLSPISPVSETHGIADAVLGYAVQETNTRRWLDEGRRLVGRKIGLTSEAVQRQLGVDEPHCGMLWADTAYESGAVIPLARFIQPKVEAEIAFETATAVESRDASRAEVAAAVAGVVTAIEIADSAIVDWRIGLADTIADNASSGGYVLGRERRALDAVVLSGALGPMVDPAAGDRFDLEIAGLTPISIGFE